MKEQMDIQAFADKLIELGLGKTRVAELQVELTTQLREIAPQIGGWITESEAYMLAEASTDMQRGAALIEMGTLLGVEAQKSPEEREQERGEKERVWREREEETKRVIDSFTSRNKGAEGDPKTVTVFCSFGTERPEPFSYLKKSAPIPQ